MRQVPPSLVLVALLAAGCGEPVVRSADLDGSIAEVRDSLEPRQRADFDEAIALLRLAGSGKVPGTERVALDGMTAAEVLAEAGRVELRRERAVEQERATAAREVLGAEERLSRLRSCGSRRSGSARPGSRPTSACATTSTFRSAAPGSASR